jgi:hypothetical protein
MARPDHSSLSNSREVMVRHSHFGASLGLVPGSTCTLCIAQHSRCIASPDYSLLCCRSVHTLLLCKCLLMSLNLLLEQSPC